MAGEDALKAAGERYLPRLDSQTDEEYAAYKERAAFFNATARTAEGYVGLIFRRPPFIKTPEDGGLGSAFSEFVNDADMLGTPLVGYAKNVIGEVIAVGRCGTLIDWESEVENRAYVSRYAAENILNWRVERINGRNITTLVALLERGMRNAERGMKDTDPFVDEVEEQIRVLRLVDGGELKVESASSRREMRCVVEIWQLRPGRTRQKEKEWQLIRTATPLRLGKPLSAIPFIFHGPAHSRPAVAKSPIEDIVSANLHHYRLNTDYKHGMHFTALPTAFVTGFDKNAQLRIGSTTAWVTDTLGATASYLEFTGDGLSTFERALDRVERLLAVLGSRLLESQKRVSESAEALSIRQAGESSIIAGISASVTTSLNEVLRWVYWWHSAEAMPEEVSAWQSGAISRDTLLHNFRTGEILPPARTNDEEIELIRKEPPPVNVTLMPQPAGHDDQSGK